MSLLYTLSLQLSIWFRVDLINEYYRCICHAFINAETQTVSRILHKALRPFWDEELDELTQKSLFWV